VPERLSLQINLAFGVLLYLHFALSIIDQMCAHLKIKCLSIPPPKKTE